MVLTHLKTPAGIVYGITAGQYGFMGKPGITYTCKTAQAISGRKAVSEEVFANPAADLGKGKILDPA
jgi:hypothetical protein